MYRYGRFILLCYRNKHTILKQLYVCVCSVAQSCLTLCDPMDCSPAGSSVHGILQARILEWVAISFSRGSSQPGIKPRSPTLWVDTLPSEPLKTVGDTKSDQKEREARLSTKEPY